MNKMISKSHHIALFGGTFNPIHFGHLKAAASAADLMEIDKIYFLPSYIPPHRELKGNVTPFHRFEMVSLACEQDPRFFPSDFEIKQKTKSYSINTVKHFMENEKQKSQFSFLIGADAFSLIDTWRRIDQLLALCDFLVMARPGYPKEISSILPKALENFFQKEDDRVLVHQKGKRSYLVPIKGIELSSTTIRNKIRSGQDVYGLTPVNVLEYINKNLIYLK